MKHLHVYTDGSGTTQGNPGGWAFLVLNLETNLVILAGSGNDPESTNNRMELTAVLEAIKAVLPYTDYAITIKSDSEYAIGCASNYWWRPKKNLDLIQQIREAKKDRPNIGFEHVKAHVGEPYNEMVDKVAGLQRNVLLSKEGK